VVGAILPAKGGEEHLPSGLCLFVLGEFGVQAGLPTLFVGNPRPGLQPQKRHKVAQPFVLNLVISHQMMIEPI